MRRRAAGGLRNPCSNERHPPTFQVVIEIQDWQRLVIYPDVAATVDAILFGLPISPEIRYRDEGGEVRVETGVPSREPTEAIERRGPPRLAPTVGRTERARGYPFG